MIFDGLWVLITCSPVSLQSRHGGQQLVPAFLCISRKILRLLTRRPEDSHGPVQTADRYCVPRRIAGLLFSFIWAGSFGTKGEEKQKSRVDQPCATRAQNRHVKGELEIYRVIAEEA